MACVNVLERVVSPMALLSRLGGPRPLLRQGGVLLLATTHQWSPEVSDKKLWLPDLQALQSALGPGYELLKEAELPFLLRDNERSYTLRVSHATVWRRT